jgi:hypothetical protein
MKINSASVWSDHYGGAKFCYTTDFLKPSDEIADVHSPPIEGSFPSPPLRASECSSTSADGIELEGFFLVSQRLDIFKLLLLMAGGGGGC